jgi:hypothetical protein
MYFLHEINKTYVEKFGNFANIKFLKYYNICLKTGAKKGLSWVN